MGKGAIGSGYTKQDLQRYRSKTQRCLDALSRMLAGNSFAKGPERMGLELELNLVDDNLDPAMANQRVLKYIDDPAFQTELGQHNIEINVRPRPLAADEALGLEEELRAALNTANDAAHTAGVGLVMIGILPTLRPDHFDERWMSPKSRYAILNRQILTTRSED
ncbi:MAG: glutamate--cysteine ligase, partial [Actinomycetota bacterium]|nr:glutamate--cysteine ligase [Actinomycetota bacterium]